MVENAHFNNTSLSEVTKLKKNNRVKQNFVSMHFLDPKARFVPSHIAFPLDAEAVELKHALVGHAISESLLSESKLPSENIFDYLKIFCGLTKHSQLANIPESTKWPFHINHAEKDGQLTVGVTSHKGLTVTVILQ